jgi:ACS family tartrate transporter-like MFS transporter
MEGSPYLQELGQRTVSRVAVRLMPFLLLLYLVAYLDRANVSYAGLRMTRDLGFSDRVFGLGAGLFFVGYFLLEIPGSLLVESWSARRWFARIMISWGLCSAACGLIHTRAAFYTLRLLLGAFEAGFAPGIVVYLSHWFRARDRGRAIAFYQIGLPLSGIIGAPLSGMLLGVHWLDLSGWRWVFIAEGLPAVLLGFVTFFYLTDWPHEARWLPAPEREWLQAELRREHPEHSPPTQGVPGFLGALAGLGRLIPTVLSRPPVLLLMAGYFFGVISLLGITIWMPKMIQASGGLTDRQVTGLVSLPYLTMLVVMLGLAWSADRTGERRWHTAIPAWLGGLGLAGAVLSRDHLTLLVPFLCLALAGMGAFSTCLWGLVTSRVRHRRGAVAVGLINSTGNLGGFVGPYLMGYLKQTTGNYTAGLYCLVATAFLAGALVLSANVKRLSQVT